MNKEILKNIISFKFRLRGNIKLHLINQRTSKLSLIGTLFLVALVTGCSVTNNISETSTNRPYSFNINLNHGQTLDIYVQRFTRLSRMNAEIEAWRSTNLFTEVRKTDVDQPTPQGYFLRINCKNVSWENTSGFVEGMLWLLSAFTFPALAEEVHQSCRSTLYENGIQIASAHNYFEYSIIGNGWGVIPMVWKLDEINAEHAQTLANHRVRKTLDAWSRRTNP